MAQVGSHLPQWADLRLRPMEVMARELGQGVGDLGQRPRWLLVGVVQMAKHSPHMVGHHEVCEASDPVRSVPDG